MFTKEQLAKYVNTYKEVYKGKKLVIGPHIVVRGSQKNYSQFLNYNFNDKPDNIFFEDTVALAIIFKTAEQIYGVKPNALGDMRYITVPYTIAWISYKINYAIDLYKIWKKQQISDELSNILHETMLKVEEFIKRNAPGSLYGEWAKKEDCWEKLKVTDLSINLDTLNNDLLSDDSGNRRKLTEQDTVQAEIDASLERIKSIHPKTWKKIENWGREVSKFSQYQINMANTLGNRIRSNRVISDIERKQGEEILNIVADENPELFFDMEEYFEEDENKRQESEDITIDLVKEIVQWDKRNKRLKPYEYRFMSELAEGKKSMTSRNLFIAGLNLKKVKKYGFRD